MADPANTQPTRQTLETPLGRLRLEARGGALTSISWAKAGERAEDGGTDPLLAEAAQQIADYFAGQRRTFALPLSPAVTAFERAVLDAMLAIPFGETRTYGELAAKLSAMPQAIGQACGANPLPIVIPCHRVIAAKGQLGGYSGRGGIETKARLLRHEGALLL